MASGKAAVMMKEKDDAKEILELDIGNILPD